MPYVLFKEDPNSHREVYFRDFINEVAQSTRDVREARTFETAIRAYEYGDAMGLGWWKVGER